MQGTGATEGLLGAHSGVILAVFVWRPLSGVDPLARAFRGASLVKGTCNPQSCPGWPAGPRLSLLLCPCWGLDKVHWPADGMALLLLPLPGLHGATTPTTSAQ